MQRSNASDERSQSPRLAIVQALWKAQYANDFAHND